MGPMLPDCEVVVVVQSEHLGRTLDCTHSSTMPVHTWLLRSAQLTTGNKEHTGPTLGPVMDIASDAENKRRSEQD